MPPAAVLAGGPLPMSPLCRLDPRELAALDRAALIYIAIGAIAFFVVGPLLEGVATVTAVISSLGYLLLVGFCLRLWVARQSSDRTKFWLTDGMLTLAPPCHRGPIRLSSALA